MAQKSCAVSICDNPVYAKGHCKSHYSRLSRTGKTGNSPIKEWSKRRSNGSTVARNELGYKECGKCLKWLPESFYSKSSTCKDGLQAACKDCLSLMSKWAKMLRKYNLTQNRYQTLLELQLGKCAICEKYFCTDLVPHIDHDHKCCSDDKTCGKCVRGLLCRNCNIALGLFGDDPSIIRRAASYVDVNDPQDWAVCNWAPHGL